MSNNSNFSFDDNQLIISPELLHFLHWVTSKEPHLLKKLIQQVFKNGLNESLKKTRSPFDELLLQESVINFFELIEQYLYEIISEDQEAIDVPDTFSRTISHLDTENYDNATIALSVARTNKVLKRKTLSPNPDQQVANEFYKELLKNWHPRDKQFYH